MVLSCCSYHVLLCSTRWIMTKLARLQTSTSSLTRLPSFKPRRSVPTPRTLSATMSALNQRVRSQVMQMSWDREVYSPKMIAHVLSSRNKSMREANFSPHATAYPCVMQASLHARRRGLILINRIPTPCGTVGTRQQRLVWWLIASRVQPAAGNASPDRLSFHA